MHFPLFVSTRLIAPHALDALPHCVRDLTLDPSQGPLLLVSDRATHAAAGAHARSVLENAGWTVEHHDLGEAPHASLSLAQAVAARASTTLPALLLAVGSGTVNDLTKYAAHRLGLPYIVCATAASMNGYSSANASLLEGGHKTSFPAVPPRLVLADLDVLAAAPLRLTQAGLGDMLCRSTVEADCLLSHYLLGTPYPREAFDRLRMQEARLLEALGSSPPSPALLPPLMDALCDGGDAMTLTSSSAVASQGEHMLVHLLELMIGEATATQALHGEWVAMTTLHMHGLQHDILEKLDSMLHHAAQQMPSSRGLGFLSTDLPLSCQRRLASSTEERLDASLRWHDSMQELGEATTEHLHALYEKKCAMLPNPMEFNILLRHKWPEISTHLRRIMLPRAALLALFQQLGLRCTPAAFPMTEQQWQTASRFAHLTRDRFTFLDLAEMG